MRLSLIKKVSKNRAKIHFIQIQFIDQYNLGQDINYYNMAYDIGDI